MPVGLFDLNQFSIVTVQERQEPTDNQSFEELVASIVTVISIVAAIDIPAAANSHWENSNSSIDSTVIAKGTIRLVADIETMRWAMSTGTDTAAVADTVSIIKGIEVKCTIANRSLVN